MTKLVKILNEIFWVTPFFIVALAIIFSFVVNPKVMGVIALIVVFSAWLVGAIRRL